jgi:hypothetical protein
MSPRTIFLSRLIGLFAILISLSMLMHKELSIETATTLIHARPLLSIVGMIVLVCGLAMVLSHNIWSGGLLPIVVTLFGWTILIRGALILFLSPDAMINVFEMLRLEELFPLYVIINLVLGLYLTYAGFQATRSTGAVW